jgi:glutamate formiminotransferase
MIQIHITSRFRCICHVLHQVSDRLPFVVVVFPVYLYGEAAVLDYRKTVPQIRAGEYEGLTEKVVR